MGQEDAMTEKEFVARENEAAPEAEKQVEEPMHKKSKHNHEVIEKLELRIAELEGENKNLQNDYLKAYADMQNLRRRMETDFEARQKYRIQSFAYDILPAIDNLERAIAAAEGNDSAMVKGFAMAYGQLMNALGKEGVEVIDPLNEAFDPNFHQGLSTEKAEDKEANIVLQVFQKGYKLKDRILRPALVKVSE
jgi:molecular chaperone GrpE